ncbi:transposase InsO family protein [Arthrobacter ginsengisoli]|uniref:Transposase InsO family protein n=1 Tax=Arthrobacter ginsengisoli TaxID=1356565 RepID=A0ABU1UDK0_9MICC|nr:transposase InsO family protein [Arthrobacter ginsengisoli]
MLKTETDMMEIVFEWVHWYNNERLHSALDHQTPEEQSKHIMIYKPAR